MRVSVVIPNWNGKNILEKNLPAVIEVVGGENQISSEIIVCDDSSTDGSASFLREKFPAVRVIEKDKHELVSRFARNKHEGFSANCNRGVKEAQGEIIVFLNSDIIPEKGFLSALVPHFSEEDVFAVGCMDKSVEENGIILRGKGIGRFERGFLVHSKGDTGFGSTLWVNGGSGAFNREKFLALGGFDTVYDPFYYEDIDLSYRAWKRGWRTLFEPKAVVLHKHEEGAIKSNFSKFYVKVVAYRNQFIFVWKNITDFQMLLSHILWLPYHAIRALLSFDFAFFDGFLMAILRLPRVIGTRLGQGSQAVSDREIFLKTNE